MLCAVPVTCVLLRETTTLHTLYLNTGQQTAAILLSLARFVVRDITKGTPIQSALIFLVNPVNPLSTVMHNCSVYVEAIIIMSRCVLRTCCEFHIISPIVKQLQTSGKKQQSTQLSLSLYRTCEINRKLSHRKSRLLICSDTCNLAVQFMSGLKAASKLELSFSSTRLFLSSSQLVQFSRSVAIKSARSIAIESYAP